MKIISKQMLLLAVISVQGVYSFASLWKECFVPEEPLTFGIHKTKTLGFQGTPYSFYFVDAQGNAVTQYVTGEKYNIQVLTSGGPFRMTMIVSDGQLDSMEHDEPSCEGTRLNFLDYLTGHSAFWVAGDHQNATIQVVLADGCTVQFIQGDLFLTKFDVITAPPVDGVLDDIILELVDELEPSLEENN